MTWPQYRRGACSTDGVEVYLTPTQTEILSILLMRRGRLVGREDLWDLVWPDPDRAPDMKNIDVQVCKLRKRLGGIIETEWGRGYRIPLPGEEAEHLCHRDFRPSDYLRNAA